MWHNCLLSTCRNAYLPTVCMYWRERVLWRHRLGSDPTPAQRHHPFLWTLQQDPTHQEHRLHQHQWGISLEKVYCKVSDKSWYSNNGRHRLFFFVFFFTEKVLSIDLTGNQISEMDEDTFRSLLQLQQLLLADNNLQVMPELPITMKHIDLHNNRLISRGMHPELFKVDTLFICLNF